ncbi:IS1249 family transposase, partial [uncultured Alistipes sp.]
MQRPKCPSCGRTMKKNGKTSGGKVRYRCAGCGASTSANPDTRAKDLRTALDWLMSKDTLESHRLPARTLQRKCELMWSLIPPVPRDGVVHDVLHLDGIHLGRDAVVLIAVDETSHVAGWHVARNETSAAWNRLLSRLAPPDMVVCDGGGGLLKALHETWPETPVQRCLFHICMNITQLTGKHPRYESSRQLRNLAIELSRAHDRKSVDEWGVKWLRWEARWNAFIDERRRSADGRERDAHERLAKARRMLRRLVVEDQMFTFLRFGDMPTANNRVESLNSRIRAMLRRHRGLNLERRIRAVCWWCHQHTVSPENCEWLVKHAVTDERLDQWYENAWRNAPRTMHDQTGMPQRYGTGIEWNDFHRS